MLGCVVIFPPIASRPIASGVAALGAFFDRGTCGLPLQTFQARALRPMYLRVIYLLPGVAAVGVGLYTPDYIWGVGIPAET